MPTKSIEMETSISSSSISSTLNNDREALPRTIDQREIPSIRTARATTTTTIRTSTPSSLYNQLVQRINSLITGFQIKWFIICMGTGITSSILYAFPYHHRWLQILGLISFGLCSVLLLILLVLFGLHLIQLKSEERMEILYDLDKNVYLGAFAMAVCSWSSMFYLITEDRCIVFVWFLYWINVALSLFTACMIVICILHKSRLAPHEITPTLLLPIVTVMVVSSFGQNVYPHLPDNLKFTSVIFSFLLWCLAVTLSFIFTTVYFYRLLVHKLPGKNAIFSSFIALGFLGQGAFSIQLFGQNYQDYLLLINAGEAASSQTAVIEGLIFRYLGLIAGLFLQSFGFYITIFAIAGVLTHYPVKISFAWWAITFPCGTMCLGANQTYKLTGWEYSRIISVIYAGMLFSAVAINLVVPTWRYIKSVLRTGELWAANWKYLRIKYKTNKIILHIRLKH